eukprot:Seg3738.2 transcript_id=Seg3738.2/GoldUCD/mRNA.D3Y31 product="hypothetical protein" protein_id=Seg3738.2/GoldUCD/D3Y31
MKIKLWDRMGNKTAAAEKVEDLIGETMVKSMDLEMICRTCYRSVVHLLKERDKKREQFKDGRKLAKEHFEYQQVKRCRHDSPKETKSSQSKQQVCHKEKRRKLEFGKENAEIQEDPKHQEDPWTNVNCELADIQIDLIEKQRIVQVNSSNNGVKCHSDIKQEFQSLVINIARGNIIAIARCVWSVNALKEQMIRILTETIDLEAKLICNNDETAFRFSDISDLTEKVNISKLEKELTEKCPVLYAALQAAGCNMQQLKRNKLKTIETVIPKLITATGILLHARNRKMTTVPVLNSMILRRGGVKKEAVARLNATSISVSYKEMLKCQSNMGNDFDKPVKIWLSEIEKLNKGQGENNTAATEISNDATKQIECPITVPSFRLIGDNCDIRVKTRTSSMIHGNKDLHLFIQLAILNRVPGKADSEFGYHPDSKACPAKFLPSLQDNQLLQREFKNIVGNVLIKYVEDLSWMRKYIPENIAHDYTSFTRKKSEVVSLGVLEKNENDSQEIVDIMEYAHTFVPCAESEPLPTLIGGDLLTVERQLNGIEDRSNSTTSKTQLAGLIPCLEDFHTFGNFLGVIWRLLFDKNSSGDIGTLYQAKNFLNAVNCPLDPMNDPDGAYDLLSNYIDALILSCYDAIKSKIKTTGLPVEQERICDEIVDEIVNTFAITEIPEVPNENAYKCKFCGKLYKRIKSYRKHIADKHSEQLPSTSQGQQQEDGALNYTCNALALGLLAKDFVSARKMGDGKRIIRLYKFLLLYFKLESRSKYSYYSLYTIMQAFHLLPPYLAHELVWNRTNNSRGKINSNVENDRTCEHHVKSFKSDCKDFQGKVSSKSIKRASCSYTAMNKLMSTYDTGLSVKHQSGRHSKPDTRNDVKSLAKQYSAHRICQFVPGRICPFLFPFFFNPPPCISPPVLIDQERDLAQVQLLPHYCIAFQEISQTLHTLQK